MGFPHSQGIQQKLRISDSLLGITLFALPVGSVISLSFAGLLVTKYGSKRVAGYALFAYSILLYIVGLSQSIPVLITALVLFGVAGNTAHIAINTQAVGAEAKYGRNIMASFHGLWSLAGFSAAAIGTVMIGKNILPQNHFIIITAIQGIGATTAMFEEATRRKTFTIGSPVLFRCSMPEKH